VVTEKSICYFCLVQLVVVFFYKQTHGGPEPILHEMEV